MKKNELLDTLNDKEKWDVYKKILLIEDMANNSSQIYEYFDDIKELLLSDISYKRVRAYRLICILSKYDSANKINIIINDMLNIFDDDKPTNIRQCLAYTEKLISNKKELKDIIIKKIKSIDYNRFKDTMSPLIKKDIDKLFAL